MGPLYVLGTGAAAVALPAVLFFRTRTLLPWQVALLPFGSIYVTGASLLAELAVAVGIRARRGQSMVVPRTLVLLWGAWLLLTMISFFANQMAFRNLFQIAKFLAFGGIAIGCALLISAEGELRRRIVLAARSCAAVLAAVFIIAELLGGGEWESIQALVGRNEGAFQILLFGVVPSLAMLATPRMSESRRFWAAAQILVSLAAFNAAEARTALGLAIMGTLGVIFLIAWRRSRAVALLLVAIMTYVVIRGAGTYIMDEFIGGRQNQFSNVERLGLLTAAWRLLQSRPLTGWGWGSVDSLIPAVPETSLAYPHPHNTFAHFGIELGYPGLALLIALYAVLIFRGLRELRKGDYSAAVFCLGVAAVLIGYSATDDIFFGANRGVFATIFMGVALAAPRLDVASRESRLF